MAPTPEWRRARPASRSAGGIRRARQGAVRLWVAAGVGAATLVGTHLVLLYTLLQELDPRVIVIDGGIAVLGLAAVAWYIGSATDERTRHAVETLMLEVLETPRNIRETAAAAVETLADEGLAIAAAVAVTREDIDAPLEVMAATGYPEGWLRQAPAVHLNDVGVLHRVAADEGWLAPLTGLKRKGWLALLPLSSGDEPIGVLLLVARKPGPLRDRRVLRALARQVAAALDHAALYEAAYARERDLVDQDARRREFLAAISHEIRTPLTSIQAFAELLEMDRTSAADDTAMQLVGSLKGGVERLRMLVTDLINLGRSGTLEYPVNPADIALPTLVERSASIMRPAFLLRRQELVLDLAPDTPHVLADRQLLEQVVLNLLANANRHAPNGTTITLTTRATDHDRVLFEVDDEGNGVPAEFRERIFEPYFRVPDAVTGDMPGSGLGLAVARRLLQQMGGRIWVAEKAGPGAKFCVELRATVTHGLGADGRAVL
ncbi:MAG: sensor histidine kinase [Dehalococcoidia bacterium]|nr:MAG: sensor histidine kinase [Dehalococcoidia bacterium]